MEVIYEDDRLLAINKPSGLIVNRSHTTKEITLQDKLDESNINFDDVDEEYGDFSDRNGIVHRLDKDTSGIIIVAKTGSAFLNIQKQFKDREVKKEYAAVLYGKLADENIEIDAPIGRNPNSPFKFAVLSTGKHAQTSFVKICDFLRNDQTYTYAKVFPHTGRTHQIRVHTAAMMHPVVMDKVYATKKQLEYASESFERMMLHSHRLTIRHPETHNELTLESPLPEEFKLLPCQES